MQMVKRSSDHLFLTPIRLCNFDAIIWRTETVEIKNDTKNRHCHYIIYYMNLYFSFNLLLYVITFVLNPLFIYFPIYLTILFIHVFIVQKGKRMQK